MDWSASNSRRRSLSATHEMHAVGFLTEIVAFHEVAGGPHRHPRAQELARRAEKSPSCYSDNSPTAGGRAAPESTARSSRDLTTRPNVPGTLVQTTAPKTPAGGICRGVLDGDGGVSRGCGCSSDVRHGIGEEGCRDPGNSGPTADVRHGCTAWIVQGGGRVSSQAKPIRFRRDRTIKPATKAVAAQTATKHAASTALLEVPGEDSF